MLIRALVAIFLLSVAGWPPVGPPPDLSAAYPNPVLSEDEGEFVVLDVPEGTVLSSYELSDGEDAVRLPAVNATGEIALSVNTTPAQLGGYTVLQVDSLPSLSNAGERIVLRRASDGHVVDAISYSNAREADVWTEAGARPLGATHHRPSTIENTSITAFALPDDTEPIHSVLESATDRIYLAGYTFTSKRIKTALLGAASRGVDVRVLLDGAPVGGDSPAQVETLDALAAEGVDVRMVGGPRARYAFYHAKYAIVDETALVLTENWKASGTGGHGNRGWGLVVHDARFAEELATVFETDREWVGTRDWSAVREPASRDRANQRTARSRRDSQRRGQAQVRSPSRSHQITRRGSSSALSVMQTNHFRYSRSSSATGDSSESLWWPRNAGSLWRSYSPGSGTCVTRTSGLRDA